MPAAGIRAGSAAPGRGMGDATSGVTGVPADPARRRALGAAGLLVAACAAPMRAGATPRAGASTGGGASTGAGATTEAGRSDGPRGLVLPRLSAPHWPVTDTAGRRAPLGARLRGHVTAVQLIFTGCSSTCPVQGAVFAVIAARPPAPDVRLLSLSVDPLSDGPAQLKAWLGRFGAPALWSAGTPLLDHVEPLSGFLRGAPARTDVHTTQVFLFDRDARLAFRTVPNPTPEHVADLLGQLARA